jgi:hypothetical protein
VLKQDSQLERFRSELRTAAKILLIESELKSSTGVWLRVHSAGR